MHARYVFYKGYYPNYVTVKGCKDGWEIRDDSGMIAKRTTQEQVNIWLEARGYKRTVEA